MKKWIKFNQQIPPKVGKKYNIRNKDILVSGSISSGVLSSVLRHLYPFDKKISINTVFTWNFGGTGVYITGDWDGWKKQIPLRRSGNEFTTIIPLPLGRFQYKFTVDGEWRYSPAHRVQEDFQGNLNNFADIEKFEREMKKDESMSENDLKPERELFEFIIPFPEEFVKDPPNIPPHLANMINSNPLKTARNFFFNHNSDHSAFSVHVFLNHILFFSPRNSLSNKKDLLPTLRARIREKLITIIFFTQNVKKNFNFIHPIKNIFCRLENPGNFF
mmetsp:Transcript_531/g.1255  ORF Transcript_531/g.1255 Transcript_531/m.1255 type:complete len:274 (-) Transcript_531:1021-1842(-)